MEKQATLTDILHAVLLIGKDALTTQEAALLTGYSVKHLRHLASTGAIPHARNGTRLFFDKKAVQKWLLADTAQPTAPSGKAQPSKQRTIK